MVRGVAAVAGVVFIAAFIALSCLIGAGAIVPTGANFDVRTGVVQAVNGGSPAVDAGIRAGDRLDPVRSTWLDHISLNRMYVYAARPISLRLLRNGRPFGAVIRAGRRAPLPDAWTNFVNAAAVLLYGGLGLSLFLMRRNTASFVFLFYSLGQAIAYSDNLIWLRVVSPGWMPFAFALGSLTPLLAQFGFLYFALLFANSGKRRDALLQYVVAPLAGLGAILYYFHFYSATIWPEPVSLYLVSTVLNWITFAVGAVVITIRLFREDAALPRLRWIATGIWLQSLLQGVFYIDQNITPLTSGGTAAIVNLNAWFQPGTLCIAYVLLRSRVIDIRVAGTRTIVYALLTAIPIALFSGADWFFSKRLEDARLATIVEFGTAVAFGIWLNTLHKRIDRFVERIVFAARQHGFTRVRNAIHALPAVEQSATVYDMLSDDCANALDLASAAVFIERSGKFERVAACGWSGCTEVLEADDPLALFVRSRAHIVHLADFASSPSAIPSGDRAPEIAVPVAQHRSITGFALYGRHRSGEHVDSGEEDLLMELGHAAGAALARLHSADRIKYLETELERGLLTL